jgi:AcrR family transcriptional regulator
MARTGRLLSLVRTAPVDGSDLNPVHDAALDAFIDYGIRRTSMGEIARRARLSPATLYRRFAQKGDLVQAVGLREVRRFLEAVDRNVDTSATAEDQIVSLFVSFAQGLRRHKLLQRLIATEPEIVLPQLTVKGGPVLELGRDYLAEFLRRLQAEGSLPPYDVLPVAELLARVALTMALLPATDIPLGTDERAREFARDHIAALCLLPTAPAKRSRPPA